MLAAAHGHLPICVLYHRLATSPRRVGRTYTSEFARSLKLFPNNSSGTSSVNRGRSPLVTLMALQQGQGGPGTADRKIVILGGGIIGASIAYFLSLRGMAATIVERSGVACAASGKAGGFLALDWTDGQPVGPLTRRSFELHAQLAEELPQDTGYRRVTTWAVTATTNPVKGKRATNAPEWLDGSVVKARVMADESTTAQVHPKLLTEAFVAQARQKAGTQVHIGAAEGVELTGEGSQKRVTGVRVDGEVLPATDVVVAMGPWSGQAASWFPIPQISGSKATSILLRPNADIPADMLFTEYRGARGRATAPEVYPRPDGSVYICGEGDSIPLPDVQADIKPTAAVVEELQELARNMSTELATAPLEKQQACYLPISPDGSPVIGAIPGISGAYIASGHSCWGILNAPATGLVMSEIILDGDAKSVDVSALDPARFVGRRGRIRSV